MESLLLTATAALFIAIAFVSWGIVGKYVGMPSAWLAVIAMGIAAFIAFAGTTPKLDSLPEIGLKHWMFFLAVCVLNGVGVIVFSRMATSPLINTGVFVATMNVLMITVALILNSHLNEDPITTRQWVFAGLAIIAVVGLSWK